MRLKPAIHRSRDFWAAELAWPLNVKIETRDWMMPHTGRGEGMSYDKDSHQWSNYLEQNWAISLEKIRDLILVFDNSLTGVLTELILILVPCNPQTCQHNNWWSWWDALRSIIFGLWMAMVTTQNLFWTVVILHHRLVWCKLAQNDNAMIIYLEIALMSSFFSDSQRPHGGVQPIL